MVVALLALNDGKLAGGGGGDRVPVVGLDHASTVHGVERVAVGEAGATGRRPVLVLLHPLGQGAHEAGVVDPGFARVDIDEVGGIVRMLGIGRGAGMEAPPQGVAALVHRGDAVVVLLAVAIPVPAREVLRNGAPLVPGLGPRFGIKLVAGLRLEIGSDRRVRKEILAEGRVMDVPVVGQGVDLATPRERTHNARQHVVEVDGVQHEVRNGIECAGVNHVRAGVGRELEDVGQVRVRGHRLHDFVRQLLLSEGAALPAVTNLFQPRQNEAFHRRAHAFQAGVADNRLFGLGNAGAVTGSTRGTSRQGCNAGCGARQAQKIASCQITTHVQYPPVKKARPADLTTDGRHGGWSAEAA